MLWVNDFIITSNYNSLFGTLKPQYDDVKYIDDFRAFEGTLSMTSGFIKHQKQVSGVMLQQRAPNSKWHSVLGAAACPIIYTLSSCPCIAYKTGQIARA